MGACELQALGLRLNECYTGSFHSCVTRPNRAMPNMNLFDRFETRSDM